MVEIKLDEDELNKLYQEKLEQHLNKLDNEVVFWDTKELEKQTNLCFNTIKDQFFYHPDFPKHKVGNKWLYPAKETKQFLLNWIQSK
ncbi:group-specific protein [Lentibacillus salicampi]|uniref:Group-specific protein n=1 Tax=Lentibacillus salicampi TaxID=175306 RepID=A0A4Y9AEW5_9BACI|nr:group-specific protein [Lentibacillus salicampi]TFJ93637.1 group-specific protein [Lentibacillus salicampi]